MNYVSEIALVCVGLLIGVVAGGELTRIFFLHKICPHRETETRLYCMECREDVTGVRITKEKTNE